MSPVLTGSSLRGDRAFTFNIDTAQTATKVAGLPTPAWLAQQSDVGNEAHLNQPRRAQSQPELENALKGRSVLFADSGVPAPSDNVLKQGSSVLGVPSIQLQGVFKQEGSDTSARARVTTFYPVTPNAGFGAEVDLTTGRGFADSQETGLNLNELYFAGSLPSLPTLRFVVGLMDLTSYFDRNSFAKDGATHFFNSVFQTNPALAAAGIASRPGLLVNWSVTDDIDLKAMTFSSSRSLGDLNLDGFAGEVGVRFGTAIIRGTYVSSRDAGQRSGFREIFDIPRSGRLGPQRGDREEAYGINAEVYIPSLKLGLFGRYGRYSNLNLDSDGTTYSAGLNFLDVFMPSDRLGLGYGRQLSNDDLREARGDNNPDVLELFYDFRITPNLRAAVMLQERNSFSETVLGVRIRTDFDISSVFRRSR
ncbi:MAG: carbohydrate porin [Lyngbya sp. HA4199-MV5]|nr:carbohydrate porin [Lyngbya sp. HA4199-MV5]